MWTQTNSKELGSLADAAACHEDVDIAGTDPTLLQRWLWQMVLIRRIEERIGNEFAAKNVFCPCHLAIGQEAPAVAVAAHVKQGDRLFGAHRSHSHYVALGGSVDALLAEVLGKDSGCSRGMGGSMHLMSREHGFFGSVPIVAATIPIATGAAIASKMNRDGSLSVSFFGDGAVEEGVFHESLNLAAIQKLPVVYVCENNLFASHLHINLRQPANSVCRFAEAHCIPWWREDGNDVVTLARAVEAAFHAARNGGGPQLIEAVTYRWRGHVGPREDIDVGVKRNEDLALWKQRDPILRLERPMVTAGLIPAQELSLLQQKALNEINAAWDNACAAPYPLAEALLSRVYSTNK